MATLYFVMTGSGNRWSVEGTRKQLDTVVEKVTRPGIPKPTWIFVKDGLILQTNDISALYIIDDE